ncbi:LuxR C-terminal-related transcriptional regulator [Streptomyces sp. NBC_00536]|uniref:helix-turn-helix transcriptional regulator n=1 Tax=Streptomyces sp. NBC_00536 TaxID=2975769 RepID=UPI002E817512|nr:LuxR C-terminal-related transcriptional regulator [Streptomyces sp. NBC_00536]WUC82531.1 LuxR C-terminal-related transcriptional regulator [Streptomyces sp. NBC_00536]
MTGSPAESTGLRTDAHHEHLAALQAWQLLRPAPEGDAWEPVSPHHAIATLLGPREEELRAAHVQLKIHQEQAAALRATLEALPLPRAHDGPSSAEVLELLPDVHAARNAISSCVADCRTDVVSFQPGGGRPAEILADALPRDLAMLDRGIEIRCIYQHPARFHQPTQDYVRTAAAAGSQIRTLDELFGQMIIVDRRVAFIPDHARPRGAVVIRQPSAVAFLYDAFQQSWNRATPYLSGPAAARTVTEEIKRTVAVLLADGIKDEVIARRLGLSLRTCRRHISELMDQLGARSRTQAGVLIHAHGLHLSAAAAQTPPTDGTAARNPAPTGPAPLTSPE